MFKKLFSLRDEINRANYCSILTLADPAVNPLRPVNDTHLVTRITLMYNMLTVEQKLHGNFKLKQMVNAATDYAWKRFGKFMVVNDEGALAIDLDYFNGSVPLTNVRTESSFAFCKIQEQRHVNADVHMLSVLKKVSKINGFDI